MKAGYSTYRSALPAAFKDDLRTLLQFREKCGHIMSDESLSRLSVSDFDAMTDDRNPMARYIRTTAPRPKMTAVMKHGILQRATASRFAILGLSPHAGPKPSINPSLPGPSYARSTRRCRELFTMLTCPLLPSDRLLLLPVGLSLTDAASKDGRMSGA